MSLKPLIEKTAAVTLIVSALGYFVDIFDLLLFSIVRVQSLRDLGVAEDDLLSVGVYLLNAQMAGLLLGGLVWGVIGDKFGRVSVLFAAILLYSLGSIANAFVTTIDQYMVLRFLTGLGLAGELGICVTLASELLPKNVRGLGTAFIATIGVMGATLAYMVAEWVGWRDAYIIGGVMGLVLLALRLGVRESALYTKLARHTAADIKRGDLRLFFKRPELLGRYVKVILTGAPMWAAVGIFITFTPEFARDFGLTVTPTAGKAVFYCYIGLAIGDVMSGIISQYLQSRKKAIALFLASLATVSVLFVTVRVDSLTVYYGFCLLMGVCSGYWAMFVQVGAEQFGTNIRATAATSIPNMVRGLTIPMAAGFHVLVPTLGVAGGGIAIMGLAVMCAAMALRSLRETFHADLDYVDAAS